jgi:hypothetical protein
VASPTSAPKRACTSVATLLLATLIACATGRDTTGIASKALDDAEVVVAAAEPDTVTVDTTVTIRITGSGFTDGSTAEWLADSMPAPGIRTVSTTYISPTALNALISISPDADLREYSIRIRNKKGKQGIGVERFRVVAKPTPLPAPGVSSVAVDVNDDGVIVGSSSDASGTSLAVRWAATDTGWSYSVLGQGSAVAINGAGLIVRRTYDPVFRAWRSWIHLPSGAAVDMGPVRVEDVGDSGTLIGYVFDATLQATATAWRQVSPSTWGPPETLPTLAGFSGASVSDINASGDIAGALYSTSSSAGIVWQYQDGQWQPPRLVDPELDGGASAINDTGALAGWVIPCNPAYPPCSSSPAFWPSLGEGRRILPTLYGSLGWANDMNNLNQVTGYSYVHYNDGNGALAALVRHAVIWFPGGQVAEDLGAIRPWESGEGRAINNHGLVVGFVRVSFAREQATAWKLY